LNARALVRQLRVAGDVLRGRGIGGTIARTAGFNVASAASAALGGVLLARTVGPAVRGEYAAVTSWFGVVQLVGDVGLTVSVSYYVAHDPQRTREYVATARATMVVTGTVVLMAGIIAAPVLAHGNPGLAFVYRLAFGGSLIAFASASYVASLLPCDIWRWNLVSLSQPVLGLAGYIVLSRLHRLGLQTAIEAIIVSMAVQLGCAYYWCRRSGLAPGCAQAKFAWPLLRYGLSQLAATMPASVNAYLDQIVLSQVAPSAALGHYAIAVSVTFVPIPLVSAIGAVAFPRLAARTMPTARAHRLPRVAMLTSAGLASAILLPIAVTAPWLIPLIFGPAYRASVPLVWILAPGGVFLACGQVAGDLLRGLGRPGLVAIAQGLAAVFTVALLLALLPSMGVTAAAIASTVAYGVALAVMIRYLLRLTPIGVPHHKGGEDGIGISQTASRNHASATASLARPGTPGNSSQEGRLNQ
jgi:O-antigen/teichoic acid export membrane protein